MSTYFNNPSLYFYWSDIALSMCIYIIAVILFLKHKRGYVIPIIIFGLFVFPIGFSNWFLSEKLVFIIPFQINPLEIFYLIFIKLCVLMAIVFARR